MVEVVDRDSCERERLEAKLQPAAIRSTIMLAGIYQITHEMIKRSVVEEVHNFYISGGNSQGVTYDEGAYQRDVLSLDSRGRFRASLQWLIEMNAITTHQADRLDDVYAHRHALTHELVNFIVDPDRNIDVDLFLEALTILKAISNFWTQIEIDIGSFAHLGEVQVDEASPLSLIVLQMTVDAYLEEFNNGFPSEPA